MADLKSIIKKQEKKNPRTIFTGSDPTAFQVDRCPTGIFTLDLITGGGFPLGKWTMLHGVESSSKSNIAYKFIGEWQKKHPDMVALLVDWEKSFTTEWAGLFLDTEKLIVIVPDFGEQGVDIMDELAKASDVGLVVQDSLAMIIPTAMGEASASDDFIGKQTQIINKMFRMLIPTTSEAKRFEGRVITHLVIQQVRANIGGGPFGAKTKKTGGHFQDHIMYLDIKCYKGKYTKIAGIPVKSTHNFTIDKNKLGIPKIMGEYTMFIDDYEGYSKGDLDEIDAIMSYAKRFGILVKDKKWNIIGLEGEWTSLGGVLAELTNNEPLLEAVKLLTIDYAKHHGLQSPEENEDVEEL